MVLIKIFAKEFYGDSFIFTKDWFELFAFWPYLIAHEWLFDGYDFAVQTWYHIIASLQDDWGAVDEKSIIICM